MRSHERLIAERLRELGGSASYAALAQALSTEKKLWTAEHVQAKVQRFAQNPDSPITTNNSGVAFQGDERNNASQLYISTIRSLEKIWSNRLTAAIGMKVSNKVHDGGGHWVVPDAVLMKVRKNNPHKPVEIHTFEIERSAGFQIESVYQALEHGRGAEFRWVAFCGGAVAPAKLARIERAAIEHKIGIILMPKATAPSQWDIKVKARPRSVSDSDREDLAVRCGSTSFESLVFDIDRDHRDRNR